MHLRHLLRALTLTSCAAALCLAPANAHALLVGAESNGELVNSNVLPAGQAAALNKMKAQGVQVVRVNWGWNEVAMPTCAGQTPAQLSTFTNPCYNWALLDSLVALSTQRNIKVLFSSSRAPAWLHNSADPMYLGSSNQQFARTTQYYAAFLAAAGARYRTGSPFGTIPFWTVWNEPNGDVFWKPRPNARRYAMLYGRAAVALKKAHPKALIAPGPTAPSGGSGGIKPVPFIRDFLRYVPSYLPAGSTATKRRYINAWAHNPYPGTGQPSVGTPGGNPSVIGMASIGRLFGLLDSSPLTRGTKVWATEFGYQTYPQDKAVGVSWGKQAQYMAESYHWLAAQRRARVTIGIWYGLTDPIEAGDWQSGTFTAAGGRKPSFRMFQRMISVPQASRRLRVGQVVEVWGRSNVAPRKGRIAYRTMRNGRWGPWQSPVRQPRQADGSISLRVKVGGPRMRFAIFDGAYGMYREVSAR